MRAVVQQQYGDVDALRVQQVDPPVPAADEVLVRVRAASVHPDVWHVLSGRPYVLRVMGAGLRRPRNPVPGTDLAGTVVSVGEQVTRFAPGDAVFGETLRGFQWVNGGAYAELAVVPEGNLVPKPDRVTFEQASTIPTAGLIALFNLPGGERLEPGDRVLVNGAGGGVGSIAMQLAKAAGAVVTGVDRGDKLELVRSLGADEVIDYTETDFTRTGERYDVIFDIPGNHRFGDVRRALADDGTYVLVGHDSFGASAGRWLGSMPRALGLMARSPFVKQLPPPSFSPPSKQESMARLLALVESGGLTAVIDTAYPLEQVATAIHHLEQGTALGRIVLTP